MRISLSVLIQICGLWACAFDQQQIGNSSVGLTNETVHEQINVANRCLFVSDQFAVCVCQLTDQQRRCLIIANRDAVWSSDISNLQRRNHLGIYIGKHKFRASLQEAHNVVLINSSHAGTITNQHNWFSCLCWLMVRPARMIDDDDDDDDDDGGGGGGGGSSVGYSNSNQFDLLGQWLRRRPFRQYIIICFLFPILHHL